MGAEGDNRRGEMTRRIRDDLLVCAYLGAKFTKQYRASQGTEHVLSWDAIAKQAGTNKQNILKLKEGKTIGLGVAVQIANTLFGGSFDSMLNQARMWWDNLSPEEREELEAWGESQANANPLKGDDPKADSSVPPPSQTGKLPAFRARRAR